MKLSSKLLGMSAVCALLSGHALSCMAAGAEAPAVLPAGALAPATATQTTAQVQTSSASVSTDKPVASSNDLSRLGSGSRDIAPGSFADTAGNATSDAVSAAAQAGGIDTGARHHSTLLSMMSGSSDDDLLGNDDKAAHVPFKAVDASDFEQIGRASWYGSGFHGRKTADGSRFNMNALTAAHRTLPLGSYLRVTNESNGKSVVVKVNDRGPYAHNRVLDLSYAAAKVIGLIHAGIARVKIQGLTPSEARAETVASADK